MELQEGLVFRSPLWGEIELPECQEGYRLAILTWISANLQWLNDAACLHELRLEFPKPRKRSSETVTKRLEKLLRKFRDQQIRSGERCEFVWVREPGFETIPYRVVFLSQRNQEEFTVFEKFLQKTLNPNDDRKEAFSCEHLEHLPDVTSTSNSEVVKFMLDLLKYVPPQAGLSAKELTDYRGFLYPTKHLPRLYGVSPLDRYKAHCALAEVEFMDY